MNERPYFTLDFRQFREAVQRAGDTAAVLREQEQAAAQARLDAAKARLNHTYKPDTQEAAQALGAVYQALDTAEATGADEAEIDWLRELRANVQESLDDCLRRDLRRDVLTVPHLTGPEPPPRMVAHRVHRTHGKCPSLDYYDNRRSGGVIDRYSLGIYDARYL